MYIFEQEIRTEQGSRCSLTRIENLQKEKSRKQKLVVKMGTLFYTNSFCWIGIEKMGGDVEDIKIPHWTTREIEAEFDEDIGILMEQAQEMKLVDGQWMDCMREGRRTKNY